MLGACEGTTLGACEGTTLGACVGTALGACEGATLGAALLSGGDKPYHNNGLEGGGEGYDGVKPAASTVSNPTRQLNGPKSDDSMQHHAPRTQRNSRPPLHIHPCTDMHVSSGNDSGDAPQISKPERTTE